MNLIQRLFGSQQKTPSAPGTIRADGGAHRAMPSQSPTQALVFCDLCGSQIASADSKQATADDLRNAVSAGFSCLLITWGPATEQRKSLGREALAKGITEAAVLGSTEAEWKRTVMRDNTVWNCCSVCNEALQKYAQPVSNAYRFRNPKLYSGYPVTALRRVVIHKPEQDRDLPVNEDFVNVFCDSIGAPLDQIVGRVHIDIVTDSKMGDEVQRTGKLPNEAIDFICKLNPELGDQRRFSQQARIFFSTLKDRYGLFVFLYDCGWRSSPTQAPGPVLQNPVSQAQVPICDVCSQLITESGAGYLLTTQQVVAEEQYWGYALNHQWSFIGQIDPDGRTWPIIVNQQAGQNSGWLVCDSCITLFQLDRDKARSACQHWWQMGRTPDSSPAGGGPAKKEDALMASIDAWSNKFGLPPVGMGLEPSEATLAALDEHNAFLGRLVRREVERVFRRA